MAKRRRYLIISDIHANEEALSAVLRSVSRRRYEAIICLGDLIGYGASPNKVTERIRKLDNLKIIRGNHDKVMENEVYMSNFNNSAKIAVKWTKENLEKNNLEYIASLPKGPLEIEEGVIMCHGSPIDEDYYLFSEFDAYQVFERFNFNICFFGHTHYPCIFAQTEAGIVFKNLRGDYYEEVLKKDCRYLINPGSIGQPRDRNPLASFAEYYPETRRFVLRRIPYDINKAAQKILKAKLPENLAHRLRLGT
ncbi:MAG: metallophosphoesterase [Acidobacteriota bacterium]|nr:metallophosphoesterase family protein [Thermoanaerobaculaceae bacterium]